MKKKLLSALLVAAMAVSTLAGCGSSSETAEGAQAEEAAATEEPAAEEADATEGVDDQAAADAVAALIDAIYVQKRTDETDAQCEAAKAGWDALTDAQKELVEGENADPDYFGRDTGDASKDDPLNEDGIGENELLVVSFGSSYNETRDLTIGAIEEALQAAYLDYEVRRAFTAQTIIDILKDREGLEIDNVTQAMSRMIMDGVKEVVIQPTHVMPGAEYDDMMAEIAVFADQFDRFKVGEPLLTEAADYDALIASLIEETAEYNAEGTAIVYMGHGTHHEANSTYATLQEKLIEAGHTNYFIGTVEASPSLDDVLALVKDSGAKKVVLLPLMIVAGDHANNDMAGDEEGSWKTTFEEAGYEVTCLVRGLGELEPIQQLFVEHAKAAVDSLAK